MSTTRTARFEKDVMRKRSVLIGAALAAIVAGVTTFVIGLQQPTPARTSMATHSVDVAR